MKRLDYFAVVVDSGKDGKTERYVLPQTCANELFLDEREE